MNELERVIVRVVGDNPRSLTGTNRADIARAMGVSRQGLVYMINATILPVIRRLLSKQNLSAEDESWLVYFSRILNNTSYLRQLVDNKIKGDKDGKV